MNYTLGYVGKHTFDHPGDRSNRRSSREYQAPPRPLALEPVVFQEQKRQEHRTPQVK
jgi:hypothetical protein